MKFSILILSLSLFQTLDAQSINEFWQESIDQGKKSFENSDYQAATQNFISARQYVNSSKSHPSELGLNYYWIAKVEAHQRNDKEALENYYKALENILLNDLDDHSHFYNIFEELVLLYESNGEYRNMIAAMVLAIPVFSEDLTELENKEVLTHLTKGFLSQMLYDSEKAKNDYEKALNKYYGAVGEEKAYFADTNTFLEDKIISLLENLWEEEFFLLPGEMYDLPYYDSFEGTIYEKLGKKFKNYFLYKDFMYYKAVSEQFKPNIDPGAMYNFKNVAGIIKLNEEISSQLGKNHPLYVACLNVTGELFFKLGDFNTSYKYSKNAYDIVNSSGNLQYPSEFKVYKNYARVLQNRGEFENVDSLYHKSIEKVNNRNYYLGFYSGISNANELSDINIKLAQFYRAIGDFENAEKVLKNNILELDPIINQCEDDPNPFVEEIKNKKIALVNELLKSYVDSNNPEKATVYLEITKDSNGWEKEFWNINLPNTSSLRIHTGNMEQIDIYNTVYKFSLISSKKYLEHYLKEMEELWFLAFLKPYTISLTGETGFDFIDAEKKRTKTDRDSLADLKYGNYVKDHANALMLDNNYEKAIEKYEHVKKIFDFNFPQDHPDYADLYKNLAIANVKSRNFQQASFYLTESDSNLKKQIETIFRFGSTEEKRNFIQKLSQHFNDFKKIGMEYSNLPRIHQMNLNNELLLKGLLLNNSRDMLMELESLAEPSLEVSISEYRITKNLLSAQYSLPKPLRTEDVESLESKKTELERRLAKAFSDNFDSNVTYSRNWKEVQKKLKRKEIAIEFSHFKYNDSLGSSVEYVAYLIKRGWKEPKVVPLFEEVQLKKIIDGRSPKSLYVSRGSEAVNVLDNKAVYELIWEPLESHLAKIKTVYFSASGILHQVSFAALGRDNLLSNKYNLRQLGSTGSLLVDRIEPLHDNTVLIGGVNYDYQGDSIEEAEDQESFMQLMPEASTRANNGLGNPWSYLPGTLQEINSISDYFKNKNISPTILTSQNATEEFFKELNGNSPNVLHIATHGFFFENRKYSNNPGDIITGNIYKLAEDPLLRSGLILSGANYAWQQGTNPHQKEDGILTALEISNLDLSSTDLVVLSACETGLGDINGTEGVYGLQRAFKMAGVDILIMSLWEVPDAETAEFMNLFYENWIGGMKVRKAFQQTQRAMSEKYKDAPEKWAAFVLSE